MIRRSVVAGQFYPSAKQELLLELEGMIPRANKTVDAIGAVIPHAGYIYSGNVAGEVYARMRPKDTYVIIGPNHTGYGARFAASGDDWQTPLGRAEIDRVLLGEIIKGSGLVVEDVSAHAAEHSIEVQLPFIQRTAPTAKILPMTVKGGSFAEYEAVASAITDAVKKTGRNVVIIASSDMTHYEPRRVAGEKDNKAIEAVSRLDAEKLIDTVEANDISMCGYIPAAIMLLSAKKLGAKKGELVKYADSGDVTGDVMQVVGYAGMIVY